MNQNRQEPRSAVRSPRELNRKTGGGTGTPGSGQGTPDSALPRRDAATPPREPERIPATSGKTRREPKATPQTGGADKWDEGIVRTAGGVDKIMLGLIILLVCLGSVMVFSASYPYALNKYGNSLYYIKRQLSFVLIGGVFMTVAMLLPYRLYRKFSGLAYGVALVLLVAVLLIGVKEGEAKRWLNIGISVQPSEIMKLSMVLLLAWYLDRYRDRVVARGRGHRKDMIIYGILFPALIIGPACGLVLLEKHLSGTAILALIALAVLFVGGAQPGYMALLYGSGGAAAGGLFLLVNPYAMNRLQNFLNNSGKDVVTDSTWQTVHGLWAISSGGLLGLGLGQSRLKYQYVSQAHNDFIFTIWCEEMGFVGAVFLIAVFALFVWRGYVIAMRAPDTFSALTVFGITTQVAIQVILNIAVVTDIIPNTGISLPFFSYGGSSLVILMAEMGVVLSISRHSYQKR